MKAISLFFALFFAFSFLLCAQGTAGTGVVTGVVRDTYGDGLPDIDVVLTNPSLGIERAMITTMDGVFDAPALPPGRGYNLRMTRKGYNSWETRDFEITAGQKVSFELILEPGTASARVNPDTAMRQVEDAGHGIYQPVTREQLNELPAANRRLNSFALEAPGTSMPDSAALTVFGRPSSTPLLLDGLNASPGFYRAPEVPRQFSLDAIHSAETLLGGFPAGFGRTQTGIINAGTMSGGPQLHGSLYEFFRSPGWNANDRFALGRRLTQKQHITGGRIGGSILPNKLFFFASFEALNNRSQGLNRIVNPLITDASGRSVASSNCAATTSQCAAVAALITPQLDTAVPRSTHSGAGFVKFDYRRNQGNNFTVEANAMNSRSVNGRQWRTVATDNSLAADNADIERRSRFLKAGWTHANGDSNFNEFRFGAFHDGVTDIARTASGPTVVVAGTPILNSQTTPGPKEIRYQLVDNLTITRNSHTLLFGLDLSRSRFWMDQIENSGGTYSYGTLTAFAQDLSGVTVGRKTYTSFSQGVGLSGRRFPRRDLAIYIQDTWRATPNLVMNLGVRWDKSTLPKPPYTDSTYYRTGEINSPNLNVVPRIGLSYRVGKNSVIRAGYGLYSMLIPGQMLDALILGSAKIQPSLFAGPTATNSPIYPYVFPYKEIVPTGLTNITYLASKIRNPYAAQANLSFERSLGWQTNLEMSLISSRGLMQFVARDTNLPDPTKTATYTVQDAAGNKVSAYTTNVWTAKVDPSRGRILQLENGGDSWYNALALQLRKRASKGVSVQASYTWSHAMDDLGGAANNGVGYVNTSLDRRADKGSSTSDQRHLGTLQLVWAPAITGLSPVARHIVNGWEVSSSAIFGSGRPVTPLVITNGQQFSGLTMLYTNSLNGSGGWNRVPFEAIGSLHTQPEYYLNARITRTLSFTESVKARLMFEAFNVLNHQPATSVNNIAYIATNGIIKPVAGAGTGIASYSYPDGTTARRAQVALRVEF